MPAPPQQSLPAIDKAVFRFICSTSTLIRCFSANVRHLFVFPQNIQRIPRLSAEPRIFAGSPYYPQNPRNIRRIPILSADPLIVMLSAICYNSNGNTHTDHSGYAHPGHSDYAYPDHTAANGHAGFTPAYRCHILCKPCKTRRLPSWN